MESELTLVRSSSCVVGRTGMGFVEIASLSTITAQSLATISSVGGPGENSFGTTNRFASAWAAGTPLFNPTKNLTFPELTNSLPLKSQRAGRCSYHER